MAFEDKLITNTNIKLLTCIKRAIRNSKKIKLLSAFIMESGVRLILEDLIYALENGAEIQILTGYYLGITEPSALYLLRMNLSEAVEISVFKHKNVSFHAKTYIFQDELNGEIFIGSSNISMSALESGVEWNYNIVKSTADHEFKQFVENFDILFKEHSIILDEETLKDYSIGWKKNRLLKNITVKDFEVEAFLGRVSEPEVLYNIKKTIKPFGAQIEALYYLDRTRQDGMNKGLVVMATGVGKTYLAAFDCQKYKRILFVAHREEILNQACESFSKVMPDRSMGFFKAGTNIKDADVTFASVQTLGKETYLNETWFKREHFDYIIIDEYHHVAANSYKGIVEYFKPRFLLGLTATPFRMDNKDIFEFCDDNLVYEINLKEAIEKDYLVPFKYYGIYDETDYGKIDFQNGKYDNEELEKALSTGKRAELIIKHYQMFNINKTIAFCSSINHANFMAGEFEKSGIKSVAVHSKDGEFTQDRQIAVEKLVAGEIKVIFAVDIFNEGVDIPEIDSVLFLRPTESFTVFLQQLGRGLRKSSGKSQLTVLDFIGNYKRAEVIPLLLSGQNPMDFNKKSIHDIDYPDECNVQFDLKVIDLFAELKKHEKLIKRLESEYRRIYSELNSRPTRVDIFEGSDISTKEFIKKKDGYIGFLGFLGELNEEEMRWIGTPVERFLNEFESMGMTKLYKIPTLKAFIRGDKISKKVTIDEIARSMMDFYKNPRYSIDMKDQSSKDYLDWTLDQYKSLALKMPVNFIDKSSEYIKYDEINRELYISDEVYNFMSPCLVGHIKDILEYRLRDKCAKLYKKSED